jgi:hypothetical protein
VGRIVGKFFFRASFVVALFFFLLPPYGVFFRSRLETDNQTARRESEEVFAHDLRHQDTLRRAEQPGAPLEEQQEAAALEQGH